MMREDNRQVESVALLNRIASESALVLSRTVTYEQIEDCLKAWQKQIRDFHNKWANQGGLSE